MLDRFDQELPELRKNVEEALNLLEQQTYIQRNGEEYAYLTDEEKDVEVEIKHTEVETADVLDELEKIVFDHVLKNRKIRFNDNGQDYSYARKLDGRFHGREHELAIHIITPFHENAESMDILRGQSMGGGELMVIMPADERLMRDITMYKQTEKYIRQNISIAQQGAARRILDSKGLQNQERYAEIQQRMKRQLGQAGMLIAGGDVEIGGEDAQSRITQGFQALIRRTYLNLGMLRGMTYTEEAVSDYLSNSQQGLFGNDATSLAESEQELLGFLQQNNRVGVRTTINALLEKFERKPYGWYYAAILCTLAMLCARGKAEIRKDGNILEGDELEQALLNSKGHANVVIEPQVEFTVSQERNLKKFHEDFFDTPPADGEAKVLGKETGAAFQQLVEVLNQFIPQADRYPFLKSLVPVVEKLKEFSHKPYTWHLTELPRQGDELLELKEQLIDPVRKFMAGPQKDIFDKAQEFIQAQEPNFPYIKGNNTAQVVDILNDPECFKGKRMQQLKMQIESLQHNVTSQIEVEIARAKESINALKDRLSGMAEFGALNGEQQAQLTRPFNEFSSAIERKTLIAVIREDRRRFEESEYRQQLSQLTAWTQVAPVQEALHDTGSSTQEKVKEPSPPEYVSSSEVIVSFEKAWLADEADIDQYLQSLRDALLEEIRNGKRIQI